MTASDIDGFSKLFDVESTHSAVNFTAITIIAKL